MHLIIFKKNVDGNLKSPQMQIPEKKWQRVMETAEAEFELSKLFKPIKSL